MSGFYRPVHHFLPWVWVLFHCTFSHPNRLSVLKVQNGNRSYSPFCLSADEWLASHLVGLVAQVLSPTSVAGLWQVWKIDFHPEAILGLLAAL